LESTSVAPRSATCAGVSVLTVACVPTGAKTGVWRVPCGVENVPVRARLLRAVMVKSNIRGIIQDAPVSMGDFALTDPPRHCPPDDRPSGYSYEAR
jgi:hypothetical protein